MSVHETKERASCGRPRAATLPPQTLFVAVFTLVCLLLSGVASAKRPAKTTSQVASQAAAQTQVEKPALAVAAPMRSATLPFNEVLDLYRLKDRAAQDEESLPPVDAVVQRLEIDGRILDKALTARVSVSVNVLADKRWVAVPLLQLGEDTVVEDLPTIKGAALLVVDGQLQLLAKKKARFDFIFGISSTAQVEGNTRSASIAFAGATLARCRLGFDPSIFSLLGAVRDTHGDVVTLHTRNNRCGLQWQHRDEYIAPSEAVTAAPEAEPVIPTARASLVSTLEGEHILRIAYALRFAGRKPITFDLPDGHVLLRAYLNGQPIAASVEQGHVELEVFAARAGQTGGELELVLSASGRDYLLSGDLALVLPRPSWRTNELYLSAHLPAAFDYAWTSGTLSPAKASPAPRYVYDIPAPGKALYFHQFLVHRSTPSLTLQYAVSLQGQYFRAGG